MKRICNLIIVALSGILMSACSDYLDVKPVGKMIPTEISQFENLLNNELTLQYFMYDNNNGCFYAAMGDNLEISENQLNYQYTATFPNLDILAAYIFYSPIMRLTVTPFTWTYSYRAIGYFNNVIDGISKIDKESEYARGIIAEAKAGRAWLYMNLALTYGPMYNPSGTNATKVIPCRTSGDPTTPNGDLSTTEEIFKQVKEDLDYACENCPLNVGNPSRINRTCAYGLRAEYYMYMRDWQNMQADCQKAWELALNDRKNVENMLYNFHDFHYEATTPVSVDPGVSPETAMTFRGPDNDFAKTRNKENLLFRYAPYSYSSSRFYPSADWQALFDKAHDLRWKLFALNYPGYSTTVGTVKHDDGVRLVYFRDKNLNTTEALTYPLLILMKAEAEARNGNLKTALADLNLLRKYRYDFGTGGISDLPNGAALNQDQLLYEILAERRREQPMATFQRTLDLKRYAFDNGKPWSKATIVHRCGTKTYSKPISDPYFQSLPIDNAILKYNPQWGISENTEIFDPISAK